MEERIDLADAVISEFGLKHQDIRSFSPLVLAFLGDNVFDLIIRTMVAEKGNRSVNVLHRQKSALVKARAQAELAAVIADLLTDEEAAVFKRGRNAKSATVPKHAGISDYRNATGLEALIGYLYLKGETGRILSLVKTGLEGLEKKDG